MGWVNPSRAPRLIYLLTACNNYNTWTKMIVYKKTDEWYTEWQRITASDNEWQQVIQRMTTSSTTSFTTSDNEWQRMTMSGKTNGNEWHHEWKRMRVILGFRTKSVMYNYNICSNVFLKIKCKTEHLQKQRPEVFYQKLIEIFCDILRKTTEGLQLY